MSDNREAGRIRPWKMPALRELSCDLRRARLLAARQYVPKTIPRQSILGGYWDMGSIVRKYMKDGKNG